MLSEQDSKELGAHKLKLLRTGRYQEHQRLEDKFHQRSHGTYIGDVIFAANDGIVTTFAVVAGAAGGGLTAIVVLILGFANLIADGLAMGFGNYLGTKSERDYNRRQRQKEEWELEHMPEAEMEEVVHTFRQWGFGETEARQAANTITADKQRWLDFMMRNELKIIENPEGTPAKHGLATFLSFATFGLLPLTPFLIPGFTRYGFQLSIACTALALFTVGSFRTTITARNWFKSGLEMLLVGSIAAVAAYFIGDLIESIVTKL